MEKKINNVDIRQCFNPYLNRADVIDNTDFFNMKINNYFQDEKNIIDVFNILKDILQLDKYN